MNAAEHARSILACAAEIDITLDGVPLADDGDPIGLQDCSGSPLFVCGPESPLGRAGLDGGHVQLAVTSALGGEESLLLSGRLRHVGADPCECCDRERALVIVDLENVLLMEPFACGPIAVADFCDPALELNPGYLRRTELHLNGAHDAHLRAAIARLTNQPLRCIAGAQVSRLERSGVELQWVSEEGAHAAPLAFARPARDADELGLFLRHVLHPELC